MAQQLACADTTDEEGVLQESDRAPVVGRSGWRPRAAAAAAAVGVLAGAAAWSSSRRAPAGSQARTSDSVQLIDRSQWKMGDPNWWNTKCPGQIPFAGVSEEPVEIVNTYFTTPFHQAGAAFAVKDGEASDGRTEGVADTLKVSLSGRSYFATKCEGNDHSDDDDPGVYDDVKYLKLKLLGKKLSYTTNMSRVGCGWDASFSLTAMAFNSDPTKCKDYYCDAMATCGARCVEISLQEANNRAWFTSLHAATDGQGVGVGYGGDWGEAARRDWDGSSYGPNATCVDTLSAFQVTVSFPVDSSGQLESMDVELSQNGCSVSASIVDYPSPGSMAEISKALEQGVTPTFQLWASTQMSWLDGQGEDGEGPCTPDMESPQDSALADQDFAEWSGFSVEDLPAPKAKAPATTEAPKAKAPATTEASKAKAQATTEAASKAKAPATAEAPKAKAKATTEAASKAKAPATTEAPKAKAQATTEAPKAKASATAKAPKNETEAAPSKQTASPAGKSWRSPWSSTPPRSRRS